MSLGPQFSQPHLPGLHVKPTDEHRYQRGFTPERKREVDSAFKNNVLIQNQQPGGYESPSNRGAFAGHLAAHSEAPWMGRREGEAKVRETIARSTADLAPMGKAPTIRSSQRRDVYDPLGTYTEAPTQYGGRGLVNVYSDPSDAPAPTKPLNVKRAVAERGVRQANEQTLLHELGHHVSSVTNPDKAYDSPAGRGKEEAFADDFRSQHYRPDPRDARRGRAAQSGYDEGGRYPADPHGISPWDDDESGEGNAVNEEFGASYLAHRQFPNKYEDHTPKRPTYPSGVPKGPSDPDIEGQGRLFVRQGRDYNDPSLDVGQHPLMDYDNNPLKTIRLGRGVPE